MKDCGWFQQDSATPVTACISLQALFDVFGDGIISSCIWPARSSDFDPCDFLFRGCLKGKVYSSNPQTEEDLKENIHREIANLAAEQFQRINQNLFHRWEECVRV
jgi:hypothetical protein